jgi:hypothetical protein
MKLFSCLVLLSLLTLARAVRMNNEIAEIIYSEPISSEEVLQRSVELADRNDFSQSLPYAPPTNESSSLPMQASCPCKSILVSSLNEAQHVQSGEIEF